MTVYARELSTEEQARLSSTARHARPRFMNAPTNRLQANRKEAMKQNKVLVRGRFLSDGREVWDVVQVAGGSYSLYAKGLTCVEEAVELAIQCMKGRVFASIGGTRLLLSAGGAFSAPVRDVGPSAPVTLARPAGSTDNTWEVRLGPAARQPLVLASR